MNLTWQDYVRVFHRECEAQGLKLSHEGEGEKLITEGDLIECIESIDGPARICWKAGNGTKYWADLMVPSPGSEPAEVIVDHAGGPMGRAGERVDLLSDFVLSEPYTLKYNTVGGVLVGHMQLIFDTFRFSSKENEGLHITNKGGYFEVTAPTVMLCALQVAYRQGLEALVPTPLPKPSLHQQGGFASRLADAYTVADRANSERLRAAFPELLGE